MRIVLFSFSKKHRTSLIFSHFHVDAVVKRTSDEFFLLSVSERTNSSLRVGFEQFTSSMISAVMKGDVHWRRTTPSYSASEQKICLFPDENPSEGHRSADQKHKILV